MNDDRVISRPSSHASNGSDGENEPLLRSGRSSSGDVRPITHLPGRGIEMRVVLCILLTELCERLTFYGITGNLVIFCKDFLDYRTPFPTTVNLLFIGTCYFIPVFGGWLADSYSGRFNVILGSALLYFVGASLLAAVSYDYPPRYMEAFKGPFRTTCFVLALFLLALGTGGIKSNVSPFGADQVHQAGPQQVTRFFNWFYCFINIGSLIAFTVIVYIQQQYSFFYGYAITASTMFLAVVIFLLGRNRYVTRPGNGSHLTDTVQIIWHGLRGIVKRKTSGEREGHTWLDYTKTELGGGFSHLQVEDVKILLGILPIFLFFIIYWTIYSQMQTSYLIQGTYMSITFSAVKLPVASLAIFDIASVLLLIPLMDRIVYPALHRCGIRFTPLRRMGVGMLFAVASMFIAGGVEMTRKSEKFKPYINQTAFNTTTKASQMNIFYQAPQYITVGISEVFTSITGLEFAYSQAPKCLQGLVMGIFLVTSGLGSYLASALVNIVDQATNHSWYKSADLNNGKLEWFFFLLGGLMFLNFLIFVPVAMQYKYVVPQKDNKENVTDEVTGNDEEPS